MKQLDNQTVVSYQSPEVEVIFYNPETSFLTGSPNGKIERGYTGFDDED